MVACPRRTAPLNLEKYATRGGPAQAAAECRFFGSLDIEPTEKKGVNPVASSLHGAIFLYIHSLTRA